MQVNMILFSVILLFLLLITRIITLESFKMNLSTITIIIIIIMLIFSTLSIKYINGNTHIYNNNANLNNNANKLLSRPPILLQNQTINKTKQNLQFY